MIYDTLIDPHTLAQHLHDPDWVIVDCRFSLADTSAGEQAYHESHIPGAVYAHLDRDLSGPPTTDRGRHPLPPLERMESLFGHWGIGGNTQVVAYDDSGGSMAARLWWMLRYLSHDAAAVLNGGWQAWQHAGLPTAIGVESRPAAVFRGRPHREWLVLLDDVPQVKLLIDSRTPERYRGEVEPIDPVAGHIPGARNYFYGRNLEPGGHFRPPGEVRQQLLELLGETPADEAVSYCGSGTTACHNVLAQAHAGLPPGRLYVGSWSEWVRDPSRQVETGE